MILDYVREKNNFVTVSEFTNVSDDLRDNTYRVRDNLTWELANGATEAWIKMNVLEATDLYEVSFAYTGTVASFHVEISLDNAYWIELEQQIIDGKNVGWSQYTDVRFKYLRIRFTGVQTGFTFNNLHAFGEQDYKVNNDLISLIAPRFYHQRFFEKYPHIPEMVQQYLRMLERSGKAGSSIQKFFDGDISIEVFLVFDEGTEGPGYIDGFPINAIPINLGSATTFSGLGAAVINSIQGTSFYDMDGSCTISLRFGVQVEGAAALEGLNKQYQWDFDDTNGTIVNPSIKNVTQFSEQIHTFTELGTYKVRFVLRMQNFEVEGTQEVRIEPSPYTIIGNTQAVTGEIYTILGLLNGYTAPTITAPATLTDHGDRTFTLTTNGASGAGEISIYDPFYDNTVTFQILFDVPLLDESGNYILDEAGEIIFID